MRNKNKKALWRGFSRVKGVWCCGHCSSFVDDPEQHANWHKDLVEAIKIAAIA